MQADVILTELPPSGGGTPGGAQGLGPPSYARKCSTKIMNLATKESGVLLKTTFH